MGPKVSQRFASVVSSKSVFSYFKKCTYHINVYLHRYTDDWLQPVEFSFSPNFKVASVDRYFLLNLEFGWKGSCPPPPLHLHCLAILSKRGIPKDLNQQQQNSGNSTNEISRRRMGDGPMMKKNWHDNACCFVIIGIGVFNATTASLCDEGCKLRQNAISCFSSPERVT